MIDFDATRAILLDEPDPNAYTVDSYTSLKDAIKNDDIRPHVHCLVAVHEGFVLVLPTLALVYHHVAQGTLNGHHWLVTYCSLCGAGSFYNANLDGEHLRFNAQGYYDNVIVIADENTQSYWNHLIGECFTGEHQGKRLQLWDNLLQMRAQEVLEVYPDAYFTKIDMSDAVIEIANSWNELYRLGENPDYGDLLKTLGEEDTRLPRHDMGLGVWTQDTKRYYPILSVYNADNVILDEVDGRKVAVCVDNVMGLMTIFYCDATSATMRGDMIEFDNNQVYKNGILYQDGQPVRVERPNHNAIRWYSFSSLFPNCEIYGQE